MHRLTDAERRTVLLEHLLANRISRRDYERRIAQLDRRRVVLSAWLWVVITGYVLGTAVVAVGGVYAFILLVIAGAEGADALVGGR